MRRAPRLDSNHREIVDALKRMGCSVCSTAALGGGFPDLVVGLLGLTLLMEVKDGSLPPSRRRLTRDELAFADGWRGHVAIVTSPQEAIDEVVRHVRRAKGSVT